MKTDTIANWNAHPNARLLNGEAAVVQYPNGQYKIKIGNGVAGFSQLPWLSVDVPPASMIKYSANGGGSFQSLSDFYYIKISQAEYDDLVRAGQTLSNALYEVSSDVEDMYGQRVVNVGYPSADTDAATKQYVDLKVGSSSGGLNQEQVESIVDMKLESALNAIITASY